MTSPHDAMAAELRRVTEERDALRALQATDRAPSILIGHLEAEIAHTRAEIPAALLLAHKGDMAAAVRTLQERIGEAVKAFAAIKHNTMFGTYVNERAHAALLALTGDPDACCKIEEASNA